MFEPRQGVLLAFKAGDREQISRAILWSTVQSLDIGLRIRKDKFANSPLVAGELVKFLAVNTGFESIERLTDKVSRMTDKIEEAVKVSKAAEKAAQTASNKSDKMKRSLESMLKWITAIERNPKLQ